MVVFPCSLSGLGKGLAGEPSCDKIHSLIAFGVTFADELSDVPEDRSGIQNTVGDSLLDDFLTVGFIFDIADQLVAQELRP